MLPFPSKWRNEVIGGVTTFLTASYIIVVNPSILATEGTGMSFSGVMTATVILCFFCTLLMGLYAKLPFVVAPGMGINAFFTYQLVLGKQIPWPIALGIVFWAGIIFLIISATPIREKIAAAFPLNLRTATACGIGLFLAFIGLKNAKLVVAHPTTFLTSAPLGHEAALTLVGFLILLLFFRRNNPFAFIASIATVTLLSTWWGATSIPQSPVSFPDFSSTFFKLDIWGALEIAFVPAILTFVFIDLFDSISTFVGVSHATGLVTQTGEPRNLREGLIVDAVATAGAGLVGSSSGTAYIESSAGIQAGGRTGWSAVITALCFLPFLFLGPIVAMVPPYATAAVLIFVGMLMFKNITTLSFAKVEEFVPALLTLLLIPLTFSITHGILWGILSYIILFWFAGRRKEVTPLMYVIATFCILLLLMENHAI